MSTIKPQRQDRPWYCSDTLTDEYVREYRNGGELKVNKILRLVRFFIVNGSITGISLYALALGANPTLISLVALLTLGSYNGVEYADYMSLLQAISEVQSSSGSGSDTDTDDRRES